MAKDFVVAIELGSSFVRGIAGKKNADGSIGVLAYAKESSSSFIHKGYVYNIDRTAEAIRSIIETLSSNLKTRIKKVYVGIGGQSVCGVMNTIVRDFPTDTKITQMLIDNLMDTNWAVDYDGKELLECSVQEYKVDNQYQTDPVGIECTHIEGAFLNIVSRQSFYRSINKCLAAAGVPLAEVILSPQALADAILSETEKRMGCALVDFGADTTTVAIYYKNIMRHLVVIPIGGNDITRDITSLCVDDEEAEWVKIRHASAYRSGDGNGQEQQTISVSTGEEITDEVLSNVVYARMAEILENVRTQIPEAYKDKLSSGFVITGGGANMPQIDTAISEILHTSKIRFARKVASQIITKIEDEDFNDGMHNTIIGLMAKGTENCAGAEFGNDDIFGAGIDVGSTEDEASSSVPDSSNVRIERPQIQPTKEQREEYVNVQQPSNVAATLKDHNESIDEEKTPDEEEADGTEKNGGLRGFWNILKGMIKDEDEEK
ncbi:MAG: cell division protein FtsA [Prevotella sp.]|nr:cell division protein FtsA [Prevotella sp.]